ncbi:MAG: class I SAM-dependent methyltransferase [Flavobacteriales bacterium]|nr:class I SAM-dependent methyltransferase [Flavobacteriales bacterium]
MASFNRKNHWENIYQTKQLTEVSWYQPTPQTSLDFIQELNTPLTAKIIDVGGGDSFLVDYLLKLGYSNITVLDISEAAIHRAKTRLGKLAKKVTWIVSDITEFKPNEQYDVWHDRAAFHFLTNQTDIKKYLEIVTNNTSINGQLIIGTFSENAPTKCSGIEIKQYSINDLETVFKPTFKKIKCSTINHPTPFNTVQNFTFCTFNKKI